MVKKYSEQNEAISVNMALIQFWRNGEGTAGYLSPQLCAVHLDLAWVLADAGRIIEDYIYPFCWHPEKKKKKTQAKVSSC